MTLSGLCRFSFRSLACVPLASIGFCHIGLQVFHEGASLGVIWIYHLDSHSFACVRFVPSGICHFDSQSCACVRLVSSGLCHIDFRKFGVRGVTVASSGLCHFDFHSFA